MSITIEGLDEARRVLGDAVLGPAELAGALGYDPLAVLTPDQRAAAARVPFGGAELAAARDAGAFLVLRIPRDPDGPLTLLRLAARLPGALDPRAHTGVGYALRDEWTIDTQPFAADQTCETGWRLVHRAPHPDTLNRPYREQDAALAALGTGWRRRTAIEIAYDVSCWHRVHGERLLAVTWDWSSTASSDQGLIAAGEFGERGLRVIAYSRAVRFGTLGVCPQR